jgi:translation initiation factor 1
MNFNDDNDDLLDNDKLTIFVKKRNNRQSDTTISGWAKDLDLNKIISYMRKHFNCSGSITNDSEFGEVICLTGDQKENVFNFLVDEQIYKKEKIIIKGI